MPDAVKAAKGIKNMAEDKSTPAKPTFTGGEQGFVSLKLANVEDVSHNTKRFRFELPEKDQVSGLHIACMSIAVLFAMKQPCKH